MGQKKTFDCSLRRNIGRFRVGCSLHFSYRQSSSPRLSRNLQKKQTSSTMNGNNSNGIADGVGRLTGRVHVLDGPCVATVD